jgi:hypothetical protein
LALGQAYAPAPNKRCRPHLKPTHKNYRIDETYIRVKGQDKYLYRAIDSSVKRSISCGQTGYSRSQTPLRKGIDASRNANFRHLAKAQTSRWVSF